MMSVAYFEIIQRRKKMHIQIDIHIDRKGDKTKTAYIIDDVCMGIHCTSLSTFLYV